MRTLLVDNYDSYTYNLYQLLAETNGQPPVVIANDDPKWRLAFLEEYDNVVISPGPGRPQRASDLGHSLGIITGSDIPLLGVCLGHQALALAAGADVGRAPAPRHGHLSRVRHDGSALFRDVPQEFAGVRYHSLAVSEPLPAELEATAWAEDGVVMALRHRELPRWGVQFHPESIAGEHGCQLLRNFRDLTPRRTHGPVSLCGPRQQEAEAPTALVPRLLRLPFAVDTEKAFRALYGASDHAFWLDSSRAETGLSRYSFLGDASGPLGEVLTYRVGDPDVRVATGAAEEQQEAGDIFEVLRRRLAGRSIAGAELPFPFTGGYVGYFGYELKAQAHPTKNVHASPEPDAVWMFADRLVVVDHAEACTYLLALHEPGAIPGQRAADWTEAARVMLTDLPQAPPRPPAGASSYGHLPEATTLVRSPEQYIADIEECQRLLRAGESYEICLTNSAHIPFREPDLDFYSRLRSVNPAPYAAFLRLAATSVFSSSPERFLHVGSDGTVESKPIKGTAPRSVDPEQDEALRLALATDTKTRSENLMIVDLLRNDLGRVCAVGSIHVPVFMATESYATVHQLVSTVRGVLRDEVSAVECARACFPGGSMTGAPKLRTMEIIDGLETTARGIYSGALGYFSLDGAADLSIVIRTAVRRGEVLSIGAGGAIVLDSVPAMELDEMLLKAGAPLRALAGEAGAGRSDAPTRISREGAASR